MMERLRTYVWVDHHTRRRNDFLSAGISVGVYMICLLLGVQEQMAVKIGIGLLIVAVIATTIQYCFVPGAAMERLKAAYYPHKRKISHLIWQFLVILLAFLGNTITPSLEAGIVDTRLRWVTQGEPTPRKIEKALQIVSKAKANNVHISTNILKKAVEAGSQFASYRSSLQALPLQVTHIETLTAAPTDPKGPPISVEVGCAKAMDGAEGRSGAIFGFAGFTVRNCADVVISPAKPEILHLDNVDSKNVTFANSTLIYNGGTLKLENVRFINCTFQISEAYANNQNVLKLLTTALNGQSITLEVSDERQAFVK